MTKLNRQGAATIFLLAALAWAEFIGYPWFSLTKSQEITATILMIAAILWITEWVPLFVISFLILALELIWLLPHLNIDAIDVSANSFYASFFSNIILLFIGGFVLSSLMQKYGLDLRFAQVILAQTKGRPAATLLGIILACSFLSMWISNTATTAMMLTIVFPLLKKIDADHPFRIALVLAIPFACNIGGIGTPIGTPPNAIALSYLTQKGFHISFFQWMAFSFPFLIIFLLFLWQLLLRLYPSQGLVLAIEARNTGSFKRRHWAAILIFLLTACGWFFGKNLGLQTGTVALLPVIAAFWFGLLDTSDFRKLPWDILYIISGGLALGVALNVSGLGGVMVNVLPMDSNPWVLLALATFAAGIMSTVMSNTATAGLTIPLIMSLNVDNQFMLTLVLSLAFMCSMAMALPVTTPPNAIAFSSRVIRTKDMMMTGSLITLFGYTCIAVVGPWYWRFILDLIGAY